MLFYQLQCYRIALKIEKGHDFHGAVPVFASAKRSVIGSYSFCVYACVMTTQIELLWGKNDKGRKKRSLVYSIVLGSTQGVKCSMQSSVVMAQPDHSLVNESSGSRTVS